MTRPFMDSEYRALVANTGDPAMQAIGDAIVYQLLDQMEIASVVAVLSVALMRSFLTILHTESPFPEKNIAAIHGLITWITESVKNHEDCAIHLTKALANPEGFDAEKPQVH